MNYLILAVVNNVINRTVPTMEMRDFFDTRTKEHIKRVGNNLLRISRVKRLVGLKDRIGTHDSSKYSPEEKVPYIFFSWYYKCKEEGLNYEYPEGIEDRITKATRHHTKVNPHHPEMHSSPKDMNDLDLAEMVADWAAMSQELGTSLIEWANNTINNRWHFSANQVKFIYELVALFPELNGKESSNESSSGDVYRVRSVGS